MGVTSAQLALFLRGSLSGTTVSTYREGNELIEILLRGPDEERERLSLLGSLAVPTASGHSVPLSQIATLVYGTEDGIIWHRNRLPTITVRGDVYGDITPPSVVTGNWPSGSIAPLVTKSPPSPAPQNPNASNCRMISNENGS
jgi:multidrug efflux pump